MIRPKKKDKYLIYQDPYYRNKRPFPFWRWAIVITSLLASLLWTLQLSAQDYISVNDVESGQLLLASEQPGQYIPAPMLESHVSFNITGMIAQTTLTQHFTNHATHTVEAVYVFPLPENAAVNSLTMQIGERVIVGKIHEKQQAQKIFQQAAKAGKKATIVEQLRPNLFMNKVANINAGEQIQVTLTFVQQIDYQDGFFSLRFPMTYTERYSPGSQQDSQADWQRHKKSQAILPEFVLQDPSITAKMSLNARLQPGFALDKIQSINHQINTQQAEDGGAYQIQLTQQNATNRDFVLHWYPQASSQPQASMLTQQTDDGQYALMMLLPPTLEPETSAARDVTFIIDVSGSMQGESIQQAKTSLQYALSSLSPNDSFNLIAFSTNAHQLFPTTVMANRANISQAQMFVANLQADGGTEMYQPLSQALAMPLSARQRSDALRQVIFITDGAVGNEQELFSLIANHKGEKRIFTVGIGSAPNGFFMRKAAQFGRGSFTYISQVHEVHEKIAALLKQISMPALSNLSLRFYPLHLQIEHFPQQLPDLYYGQPLMLSFKTSQLPGSVAVSGDINGQSWYREAELLAASSDAIASVWARAKIEDLLDQQVMGADPLLIRDQVLNTSLTHQVLSPFSAFVAVEQRISAHSTSSKLRLGNAAPAGSNMHYPTTATGWQVQFIIASLLVLALIFLPRRGKVHV